MPISIKCTHCGTGLRVPDNATGKKVRCAKCQQVFTVEQPEIEVRQRDPAAAPSPAEPGSEGAEIEAVRPSSAYNYGEKVVLTLPMRNSAGEVPAGTPGTVVDKSLSPKQDWLLVAFQGYKHIAESMRTFPFKLESLEQGNGRRFLREANGGSIPLRRIAEGWCLPDGEVPMVEAQLRSGKAVRGGLFERTAVGGNFNIASQFLIGNIEWDSTGEGTWKGLSYQAEDVLRLVWLSNESPPKEPPAELGLEPWQRFAKYVKVPSGIHESATRSGMQFQFTFKDKNDADRVLGILPSEYLVALRRGECWFRGNNQKGRYQLAWNGVELTIAQAKDLMNQVVKAGGEIFEASLE